MPFPEWFGSGQDEAAFLRRVLNHVSDCLVAVDTQGRIVLINEPYCQLLGGRQEDFIGKHITEVVSQKTQLHRVARGETGTALMQLEVKGHQLLARQVAVYQDQKIIGAVGLALFSDMNSLKNAMSVAVKQGRVIQSSQSAWRAKQSMSDLMGRGPFFERLKKDIVEFSKLHYPVLVTGETGTGKDIVANALHAESARSLRPFVWLNCASIPESLIDTELFGYEGGAFTGAQSKGKPGKFELADGGTLFLDEIGDMPLNLQASLLRALQNQEIVRVGGVSPVSVDVRIICATHRNLSELVKKGQFRIDLYHRLNVLKIEMPPLRDRDDLEFVIDESLRKLSEREGIPIRKLPADLKHRYLSAVWPGNMRELEAELLRYLVTGADTFAPNQTLNHFDSLTTEKTFDDEDLDLERHLRQERLQLINRAVILSNGDKDLAARRLGISRATLYRELQRMI